jgi:hypothetical protein
VATAFDRVRSSRTETSTATALLGKFTGTLGSSNRRDDYSLIVSRRGRFSASLTGLKADAALQLVSEKGRVLAQSDRLGRRSESVQKTLNPGTYSVRVLRRTGRTKYVLSITDESSQSNPVANSFRNLWGEYHGTSVTTTGLVDPLSGRFIDGPKSFRTNITARIKARISARGSVETNPFNLSISSSALDLGNATLGAIAVYSALPDTQNILRQAWSLKYNGNRISGTLTSSFSLSNPSAPNYFFADTYIGGVRSFFSSPMNAGTTLQGTLVPNRLQIRLQGLSGTSRVFVIDITARRRKKR